jgi:membrane associated rhomboid family serine protease
MARMGSSPLSFPDFKGATRRLILINLAAFFALLLANLASIGGPRLVSSLAFDPAAFLHGYFWQPFSYSFVHPGLLTTLFELLSLWFLAGFLENFHDANWVMSLYAVSVLGTSLSALALYAVSVALVPALLVGSSPIYGCFGGIFGLLAAIGLLYGDTQFMMFPLPIGIKARYLVVIYALIAVAMLFGQQRLLAFAQLGGALGATSRSFLQDQ